MTLLGGINLSIAVIGGFLITAYFLFILWAAVDALRNGRIWWFVIIVGMPIVGATVYFFVEKKHDYLKIREE